MNTLNQAKQLQDRTKQFAIRIIKAFARLPKDEAARIIGRQFLRSGTSLAATSNADLVNLIPPLLHGRTMLLTLQNGLGNEEFLAEYFGAERVLGGLCFICLSRVSRTEVERYDYGHIMIGEYESKPSERTHAIALHFSGCGIKCSVAEDLALEHWRKLVWNIPFNGLSILAGGIDTATILVTRRCIA